MRGDPAVQEVLQLGAGLGVPDHGRALARRLRQGEPAQPPESTGRIGLDAEVSGLGDYILGVFGLVAVVLSMAIAGRTTRRAALPSWTGPPALLADTRPRDRHPDRGRGAARSLRRSGRGPPGRGQPDRRWRRAAARADADPRRRPRRPLGRGRGAGPAARRRPSAGSSSAVAVILALIVAAQWAGPTLLALDRGIYGGDSLWYHMPLAAHIAETGLDHLAALHRSALSELVLPAGLRAAPRGRDPPLRQRLHLAADQHGLAGPRPVRGLVHRPPLRHRAHARWPRWPR